MIIRFLTIVIFSTMLLAQDNIKNNIDSMIENINNAPIKERYVLMNQLKQLLKNKNKEFRKTIIKKLQIASINNRDMNQNAFNNIKINPNIKIDYITNTAGSISLDPTTTTLSIPTRDIKPKQRNYRSKV